MFSVSPTWLLEEAGCAMDCGDGEKDSGTTVKRPQSQFYSEQSIESDNVAPLAFPFPQ